MTKLSNKDFLKIPVRKMFIVYNIIFILGILSGLLFSVDDVTNKVVSPNSVLFVEIFLNNLVVGSLLLVGGLLSFGVLSSLIILVNGAVVGELIKVLYIQNSLDSLTFGLLPHLIFELPALILFAMAGTFTGHYLFLFLKNKHFSMPVYTYVKTGIKLFILGFLMLLIASIVEDYISFVNN